VSGIAASVDADLSEQIRSLVAQGDPTSVPSGILLWFGDTALPAGTETEPPSMSAAAWVGTYLRLMGGAVSGAPRRVPALPTVQSAGAQPGEPVPLAIVSAAFHRPTTAAAEAVRAAGATGGRADLPDSLATAIEPAETLLVTALLSDQWHRAVPAHRGRAVTLTLPSELLITNDPNGSITDVAVDVGSGWQPIGSDANVHFEAPGGASKVEITVRCTTTHGERFGRCEMTISDDPVPPAPDETWHLTPDQGNTGHAFVFRCSDGDRLRRPILIAEGWPGNASAASLAEALGQHRLLERWHAAGHDVIVIGFDNGLDAMQSNTGVVHSAIHTALARTDDALTVGGMSMGALISRLALMEMERDGDDHRAAVYLSIDGPHGRGAYTTVVGQWLAQNFTWLSPAYAGLAKLIRSPSNLEFISLIESNGALGPDPMRTAFLAELDRLGGYPTRPVKLAIACGSGHGSTAPPPTAPVLRWDVPGLVDVTLLPLPQGGTHQIAAASITGHPGQTPRPLVASSEICWESVQGARDVLNDEVTSVLSAFGCAFDTTLGTSASLPTVSSLDVDGDPNAAIPPPGSGSSPFDDYTFSATDQRHLQFTSDIVDWMIDRVERHQPDGSDHETHLRSAT
jgi:hypothetical protein